MKTAIQPWEWPILVFGTICMLKWAWDQIRG